MTNDKGKFCTLQCWDTHTKLVKSFEPAAPACLFFISNYLEAGDHKAAGTKYPIFMYIKRWSMAKAFSFSLSFSNFRASVSFSSHFLQLLQSSCRESYIQPAY